MIAFKCQAPLQLEQRRVLAALAPLVVAAWCSIAAGGTLNIAYICSSTSAWSVPSLEGFEATLVFVSFSQLALAWCVMIVAMMLPMLAGPIAKLRIASFESMRLILSVLFALGYLLAWMAAGFVFAVIVLATRIVAPNLTEPFAVAICAAVLWQISPWKQAALNRCHRRQSSASFGWAAYGDALWAGYAHGAWCLASCWAVMLAPLLAPSFHVGLMLVVAAHAWIERLEIPRAPAWRITFPMRAIRAGKWLLGRRVASTSFTSPFSKRNH